MTYAAVILAGGAARRLGGLRKPFLVLDGERIIDRVVAAARDAGAAPVVVVGPPTGISGVVHCVEDPPRSGPAMAVVAGVEHAGKAEWILTLGGDMPWVGAAVSSLLEAAEGDGAVLIDAEGRAQPLAAVYRRTALADRAAAIRPGDSLRRLTEGLELVRVTGWEQASADVDTWDDVRAARMKEAGAKEAPVTPPRDTPPAGQAAQT